MNLQIPHKIKTEIERLAYYQIAGGTVGIFITIWLIAQTNTITGLIILIFVLAVGLYSFSIYCGRLLIKEEFDIGLRLSTINQAFQVFSFTFLGFAFKFVAGLCLDVGFDYTNSFKFAFNFSLSAFHMSVNTDDDSITLGLNILAVFVIQYIAKIKGKIEDNNLLQTFKTNNEVSSIGQDIANDESES